MRRNRSKGHPDAEVFQRDIGIASKGHPGEWHRAASKGHPGVSGNHGRNEVTVQSRTIGNNAIEMRLGNARRIRRVRGYLTWGFRGV